MRPMSIARLMLPAIAAVTFIPSAIAGDGASIRYDAVPEGAWSIVAEVRAKPGKEAALREATLPLVELVRSDPKNLVYFLQEDRAAPGHFVFYEIFASESDFKAHNAMPYVQTWFEKLPELAQGGVTVMQMGILGHKPK
ncbi:putative quinol monooxygenase [Novosphingobium kaempferiae]|uniref:putative quinol monooxygenase n=1 Tax=Novosphingobium kaempferiae TaxID=2896849 RepID=UPI001E49AEC2|nr:putative quinol monooxygenase [Novosphingobium kaempferiae]